MSKVNVKCSFKKMVKLHKLVPHPRNCNNHGDRQIELLAKIIDYQGQRLPIVVSKLSGFICAGHGRLMALQKLGWDECAVDYQDFENEAEEFAFLIADNKIAELADHDDLKMIEGIKDLKFEDFELLGMDDFKLEIEDFEPSSSSGSQIKEKELDENIPTDHKCPSCGYIW